MTHPPKIIKHKDPSQTKEKSLKIMKKSLKKIKKIPIINRMNKKNTETPSLSTAILK